MALIKCSECSRDISDKATACPHCGCPVEIVTASPVESATPYTPPPVPQGTTRINWIPALVVSVSASVLSLLVDVVELFAGEETGLLLFGIFSPVFILATVFWGMLHYRCWKALPENRRVTTPARAIGFMFIPVFNFFWAFVTWPKLSVGLLQWQRDVGADRPDDTRNMAYVYAVLFVVQFIVCWIPAISILTNIADTVVFFLYYRQVVSGLNRTLAYGATPVSGA